MVPKRREIDFSTTGSPSKPEVKVTDLASGQSRAWRGPDTHRSGDGETLPYPTPHKVSWAWDCLRSSSQGVGAPWLRLWNRSLKSPHRRSRGIHLLLHAQSAERGDGLTEMVAGRWDVAAPLTHYRELVMPNT